MESISASLNREIEERARAGVIAVIDDDSEIIFALTSWLGFIGYRPVGFSSAEAVIEALCGGGAGPEPSITLAGERTRLVGAIIDVMLPGMSGFQLAARLRDADPEFPVVLMSAGTSVQLANLGQAPDGVPLLRKPFDLAEMAVAMFGPGRDSAQGFRRRSAE